MVMQRTWDSWTDWEREDQAENGGVSLVLHQLQVTTCMSMNNDELNNRYYWEYFDGNMDDP